MIQAPTSVSVTVISNEYIGENVRHLKIEPHELICYEAGQFFMLGLLNEEGRMVERSYSIANAYHDGPLEFVIRITHGPMTSLIDALKVGDSIFLKGPFGKFGHLSAPERLVLIAGGVGISPLRGMIQRSFQQQESFPIQLFYGFRTPQDFLFREELESYAASGRLTLIPMASREGNSRNGSIGNISDGLEGNIFSPTANTPCFVCGPPLMVKATREKLLELGFDRKQVHVEAW